MGIFHFIRQMCLRPLQAIRLTALMLAIILLSINVIGVFRNWKLKTEIVGDLPYHWGNDLTEAEFYDVIRLAWEEKEGTGDLEKFVRSVHGAVNRRLVLPPWNGKEVLLKERVRMPVWRNYLLFLVGLIRPEYEYYEHCSYRRAVRRQVGLCSQHALVFSQILVEYGIRAFPMGLNGHVVATVEVAPDVWWTYDPSWGVIIPKSIPEIQEDPTIIIPFYTQEGYISSTVASLVDIYKRDGNEPYNLDSVSCRWRGATYAAIWLIPIGLLFFSFVPLLWRLRSGREKILP